MVVKRKYDTVYYDRAMHQFVGITPSIRRELQSVYKTIDIERELAKMTIWLESSRGRQYAGNIGFIMSWLEKATPTKQEEDNSLGPPDLFSPIGKAYESYLKDLWKNRATVLDQNERT